MDKIMRERRFQVPGDRKTTYRVRFTQNAFLVLQQATGKGISELSRAGIVELQQLLWGGLEGARLKDRTTRHGRPFDMLDVGDLLETIYENDGKVFDLDAQAEVKIGELISEAFLAATKELFGVTAEEDGEEAAAAETGADPTDGPRD